MFFFLTSVIHLKAQVAIGVDSPQTPQPFSILELFSTTTTGVGALHLPHLNEMTALNTATLTTVVPTLIKDYIKFEQETAK